MNWLPFRSTWTSTNLYVVPVAPSLFVCVVFYRSLSRFDEIPISSVNHTKMCVPVCEISLQTLRHGLWLPLFYLQTFFTQTTTENEIKECLLTQNVGGGGYQTKEIKHDWNTLNHMSQHKIIYNYNTNIPPLMMSIIL